MDDYILCGSHSKAVDVFNAYNIYNNVYQFSFRLGSLLAYEQHNNHSRAVFYDEKDSG